MLHFFECPYPSFYWTTIMLRCLNSSTCPCQLPLSKYFWSRMLDRVIVDSKTCYASAVLIYVICLRLDAWQRLMILTTGLFSYRRQRTPAKSGQPASPIWICLRLDIPGSVMASNDLKCSLLLSLSKMPLKYWFTSSKFLKEIKISLPINVTSHYDNYRTYSGHTFQRKLL
jgi:hypothetical protein